MGSKTNSFENLILSHIFNNSNIANVGDAAGLRGSVTPGNLYIRLYTSASVVDESNIGTECAYAGYVSKGVAVPRSSVGWTVSGNNVVNAAAINFGECTSGSETIRYIAVWVDNVNTSDAYRLFWGQLSADLVVSSAIKPSFPAGSLSLNED